MLLFLNMCSEIVLGNVILKNVTSIEINENILEMQNTARITIPKNYSRKNDIPIWQQIKVGDKVQISLGYDDVLNKEFVGYIREIEDTAPLVIHCDDETYLLRKSNYVKSYRDATLKQILNDIILPTQLKFDCPDVHIGKYQIDNASGLAVLYDLMKSHGLYSRIQDGALKVGLSYEFGEKTKNHTYYMNEPITANYRGNVRKCDLKYKRKEDFKVRYKAIANNPNGKNTTVVVGDKVGDVSERTLNFAGPLTEKELKEKAEAIMKKTVYDGFTGNITGFGIPPTHAGDSLTIKDYQEPQKDGTYLIERVEIMYSESEGFSRKNELIFKL